MIFVTVGTHEQPFDRLIKFVDELVKEKVINENVFIQTGFSNYVPQYCEWSKFLSHKEMNEYMEKSKIVITHGGPSTFMKALSLGKKTIVVPRLKKYNEHVNNHQLSFAKQVKSKGYNITIVEDVNDLGTILYNKKDKTNFTSNNDNFVNGLSSCLEKMGI